MDKIKFLPLREKYICLPLPKSKDFYKWTNLKEKLRTKKEKYLEGVKKFGTVGEAMQYAGIKSRQTLVNYRNSDKEFKQNEIDYFGENDGMMCDLAEKQLFLAIKDGDITAIKYFLDRRNPKYKPRGEVEMRDMTEIEKYRHELKELGDYVKTEIGTNSSGGRESGS